MPIAKKEKEAPGITTASLPDIVFMLLCFFMVVTKMRDADIKVRIAVPQATELQKLVEKSLTAQLFIGKPTAQYEGVYGTSPRLQLNDAFAEPKDITQWANVVRQKVPPAMHKRMTVAMRIDGDVKMGLITEVKTELRKVELRKISYLANKRSSNE